MISQPDTPMSCNVGSSDTTPTVLVKDVCTHFHFFREWNSHWDLVPPLGYGDTWSSPEQSSAAGQLQSSTVDKEHIQQVLHSVGLLYYIQYRSRCIPLTVMVPGTCVGTYYIKYVSYHIWNLSISIQYIPTYIPMYVLYTTTKLVMLLCPV